MSPPEREKNGVMVLGAGIDQKWLEQKEGVSVSGMPTYFGKINYTVKKEGKTVKINVTGDSKPPEGFVFKSPFIKEKIKSVKLNGNKWEKFSGGEISFKELPADITAEY